MSQAQTVSQLWESVSDALQLSPDDPFLMFLQGIQKYGIPGALASALGTTNIVPDPSKFEVLPNAKNIEVYHTVCHWVRNKPGFFYDNYAQIYHSLVSLGEAYVRGKKFTVQRNETFTILMGTENVDPSNYKRWIARLRQLYQDNIQEPMQELPSYLYTLINLEWYQESINTHMHPPYLDHAQFIRVDQWPQLQVFNKKDWTSLLWEAVNEKLQLPDGTPFLTYMEHMIQQGTPIVIQNQNFAKCKILYVR